MEIRGEGETLNKLDRGLHFPVNTRIPRKICLPGRQTTLTTGFPPPNPHPREFGSQGLS